MLRYTLPVLLACSLLAQDAHPPSSRRRAVARPQGLWSAALVVEGREVPFRFEVSGEGAALNASFFDGDRRITSTSASFTNGVLEARWDYYDSNARLELINSELRGLYTRVTRRGVVRRPFFAKPHEAPPAAPAGVLQVGGEWMLDNGKRVSLTMLRQTGAQVSGTIQRLDGDTGTLTGTVDGQRLVLSNFDGIRATYLEATSPEPGKLVGVIDGAEKFTALRPARAKAAGMAAPVDPSTYISVRDPREPFQFSFPDATGALVSSTDVRFRGKVVIVTLMGTWCPNCHDEAPVLSALYEKYRAQGLEVVALAFEYTPEVERSRQQLQAFARRHKLAFPLLLAGTTDEGDVQKKLPQISNFPSFPTTLYLGRDGRVAGSHVGFSGPATGKAYAELKLQMEQKIQTLLARK